MGRVRPGVGIDEVEQALQQIREMRVDGVECHLVAGVDLGLRDGNAGYAITVDLADEGAYRIYDRDPEHNRIRAEVFAPISESVDRVQFRLPD